MKTLKLVCRILSKAIIFVVTAYAFFFAIGFVATLSYLTTRFAGWSEWSAIACSAGALVVADVIGVRLIKKREPRDAN